MKPHDIVDVSVSPVEEISQDAGVYTWEIGSDTVYADAAVAAMFGLDAKSAEVGMPIANFLDRIHPDDRPATAKRIETAIITGDPYQASYRLLQPDGTSLDVTAYGRCFRDRSGEPSVYAGVIHPNAALTAAEDELLWHCLRAYEIAKNEKREAVAAMLLNALRDLRPTDSFGATKH